MAAGYEGRAIDLVIGQGTEPYDRKQRVDLSLLGEDGRASAATGVYKLVQVVLSILMSKKASNKFRPADGTTFLIDAARGGWRSAADVEQSFRTARLDVVRQTRARAVDATPDDERLAALEFRSAGFIDGRASVSLYMETVSGESTTLVAPIKTDIR